MRLFSMAVKILNVIWHLDKRCTEVKSKAGSITEGIMVFTAGVIAKKKMSIYNDACKSWPGRKVA